jgi:hypothetical protein
VSTRQRPDPGGRHQPPAGLGAAELATSCQVAVGGRQRLEVEHRRAVPADRPAQRRVEQGRRRAVTPGRPRSSTLERGPVEVAGQDAVAVVVDQVDQVAGEIRASATTTSDSPCGHRGPAPAAAGEPLREAGTTNATIATSRTQPNATTGTTARALVGVREHVAVERVPEHHQRATGMTISQPALRIFLSIQISLMQPTVAST